VSDRGVVFDGPPTANHTLRVTAHTKSQGHDMFVVIISIIIQYWTWSYSTSRGTTAFVSGFQCTF